MYHIYIQPPFYLLIYWAFRLLSYLLGQNSLKATLTAEIFHPDLSYVPFSFLGCQTSITVWKFSFNNLVLFPLCFFKDISFNKHFALLHLLLYYLRDIPISNYMCVYICVLCVCVYMCVCINHIYIYTYTYYIYIYKWLYVCQSKLHIII